jgi:hypothetical protein
MEACVSLQIPMLYLPLTSPYQKNSQRLCPTLIPLGLTKVKEPFTNHPIRNQSLSLNHVPRSPHSKLPITSFRSSNRNNRSCRRSLSPLPLNLILSNLLAISFLLTDRKDYRMLYHMFYYRNGRGNTLEKSHSKITN